MSAHPLSNTPPKSNNPAPKKSGPELEWDKVNALGEKALKSIEDAAFAQERQKEEIERL